MPRRKASVPSYRKCRIHGNTRALVTLTDSLTGQRRNFYFGAYGTPESREKYLRLLAQWEARGRRFPDTAENPITPACGPTITQLCHEFWMAIQGQHSRQTLSHFKASIRLLKSFYGETPVVEFGPRALHLLREQMIKGGNGRRPWTRRYANAQCAFIRRIFKWGVSYEIVPVAVHGALHAVEPLRHGRTSAIDTESIKPVPDALLKKTLPHLNRPVRALVELQLLTGARPSELLTLRPCDFEMDEHPHTWIVQPAHHKTAHHGHARVLYFGPQAQAVLQPFFADRRTTAFLFSPAEAERERREVLHAARRTPLSCGNRPGKKSSASSRRPLNACYDKYSYRRSIQYACDRAFPPPQHLAPRKGETEKDWRERLTSQEHEELKAWRKDHRWFPYQLRKNAATALRRQFGLEAAQLILGHSSARITDAVYADRDREKILQIVQETG